MHICSYVDKFSSVVIQGNSVITFNGNFGGVMYFALSTVTFQGNFEVIIFTDNYL